MEEKKIPKFHDILSKAKNKNLIKEINASTKDLKFSQLGKYMMKIHLPNWDLDYITWSQNTKKILKKRK